MSDLADDSDEIQAAPPPALRRPSSGQFARPPMSSLEAADIANSEWGKDKDAAIARVDEFVRQLHVRIAVHDRRWAATRKVLIAVTMTALSAVGAAFKLAYSSGAASGASSAASTDRARLRETVERLDRNDAADRARMDAMFETLRLRYPIGSIPLIGPPNDPNPKGTAP